MSAPELLGEDSVFGPRTYVVGVPLVVNVHADGRVTYEVDLTEVTDDLGEHSENSYSVIEADTKIVQADVDRRDRVHMVDAL
jgi:hypothetical protein